MTATQRRFTYKCEKGHVAQKLFPLGTSFKDNDEIKCPECLKVGKALPAYLVFAAATATEGKGNGGIHS